MACAPERRLSVTRRGAITWGLGAGAALSGAGYLTARNTAIALFIYDGHLHEPTATAHRYEWLGVQTIDCRWSKGTWLPSMLETVSAGGCVEGSTLWVDSFAAEAFAKDCGMFFKCDHGAMQGTLRKWRIAA